MTTEEFSSVIYNRLRSFDVEVWDIDVLRLATIDGQNAGIQDDDIKSSWISAVKRMRSALPEKWKNYERFHGRLVDCPEVPWEKVVLVGGSTNGDVYLLQFDVDGTLVTLTCKDTEIINPDFVMRKLELHACKLIDCPHLARPIRKNWLPNVVLVWLKAAKMKKTEHENPLENVMDAILDYASHPIWKKNYGKAAFEQGHDPIRDEDTVYIPFTGCYEYLKKHLGVDNGPQFIALGLKELGAVAQRKGEGRKRFYLLGWQKIQSSKVEVAASMARSHPEPSAPSAEIFTAWDGLEKGEESTESADASEKTGTSIGGMNLF